MVVKYLFAYLFSNLGLILTYNDYIKAQPVRIEGKVIDLNSGLVIPKAHVFIIKGEEETFSDNRGEFQLETLKGLPLNVTIEKAGYGSEEIKLTTVAKPIKISLKRK